jgi:LmbE family N-acetylglucosaminyl deacetylase
MDKVQARENEKKKGMTTAHQTIDTLILAPHPDDEVLCCSGVIAGAVAEGMPPLIVVATNGDTHHSRSSHEENTRFGLLRQTETLRAMRELGVPDENVLFLGYPGSSRFQPSRYTGRSKTYGDHEGLYGGKLDYHTTRFGHPADYSVDAFIGDVQQILHDYAPAHVFLPVSSDTHADHRLVSECFNVALKKTGQKVTRHYWIAHAAEGDAFWPTPPCSKTCPDSPDEGNPEERYRPEEVLNPPQHYPPFDEMIPSAANKRTLLELYQTQVAHGTFAHGYLLACTKRTEGFWKRDISVVERYVRLMMQTGWPVNKLWKGFKR